MQHRPTTNHFAQHHMSLIDQQQQGTAVSEGQYMPGGRLHAKDPEDIKSSSPLMEEHELDAGARGITPGILGGYRWIAFNETRLTTMKRWRNQPYFCPYKPLYGKWIITCASYLSGVSTEQYYIRVHSN